MSAKLNLCDFRMRKCRSTKKQNNGNADVDENRSVVS